MALIELGHWTKLATTLMIISLFWAPNPLVGAGISLTMQLCTGCHDPNGAAKSKLVGDSDHPVEVKLGQQNLIVSIDPKTVDLPLYDSDGNKKADKKIVCMTCHDPHRWDPKTTEFSESYAFTNVEGTPADSFLRKANAPSSGLCNSCHSDQAQIVGSAHDLRVTAPKEKNLRLLLAGLTTLLPTG